MTLVKANDSDTEILTANISILIKEAQFMQFAYSFHYVSTR